MTFPFPMVCPRGIVRYTSAQALWTPVDADFTWSGDDIAGAAGNNAVRTVNPVVGDFDFRLVLAGGSGGDGAVMGAFAASELGTFNDGGPAGGMTSMTAAPHFYQTGGQRFFGSTNEATPGAVSNGDVLILRRVGSTFTLLKNGSLYTTWTGTSSASMYLCLGSGNGSLDCDDIYWEF